MTGLARRSRLFRGFWPEIPPTPELKLGDPRKERYSNNKGFAAGANSDMSMLRPSPMRIADKGPLGAEALKSRNAVNR